MVKAVLPSPAQVLWNKGVPTSSRLHGDGWAGLTSKGRRGCEEESPFTAMRSGSRTTGQSSFIFRNPEVQTTLHWRGGVSAAVESSSDKALRLHSSWLLCKCFVHFKPPFWTSRATVVEERAGPAAGRSSGGVPRVQRRRGDTAMEGQGAAANPLPVWVYSWWGGGGSEMKRRVLIKLAVQVSLGAG